MVQKSPDMKTHNIITGLLIVWLLKIMASCSRPSEEPDFSQPVRELIIDDREGFFSINLDIVIILIIIVLAILLYRYILILRDEHASLKNKGRTIERKLDILDDKQQKLHRQLAEIEISFQKVRAKLERWEEQNINQPSEEIQLIKPGIETERVKPENENKSEVFFMPAPDNEGVFDNRKKSRHFIPAESVYKFISDPHESQKASFMIYEDANNMERAINYYSSILEKVCKADNAFNPHKKIVSTISPGIAILENNKWIVKEKTLVRYE